MFLQPLLQTEIIPKEAIKIIFSNIDSILVSQVKLLENLEIRMKNMTAELALGDVFLEIVFII